MATQGSASDAAAFVNTLYRKVLLSVKASNAVPSEDDGFHYHCQFSAGFAAQSAAAGAHAAELVRLLTKRPRAQDGDASDDESGDEDEQQELFDGPEPNARITDYADMLLDEASKHLARFVQGDSAAPSALENKPQGFDTTRKTGTKLRDDDAVAAAADKKLAQRGAQDKPQSHFDEVIDNSDAPFVSKLREKVHALPESEAPIDEDDEDVPRHPYFPEIRALKYAAWQLEASKQPYEKVALEDASYLWVDSEQTLMQMMQSLTAAEARVIAVDLEHHSYRSYMGLTCLMQISTAREDFLVDTLALRGKLQTLNTVFCDPKKVKVLHGSDMDILWLQRDLGLYVVNLFDTGQAARLLQYPRFSLAYMLKRHCNVDADKQYQLADWRARPLEANMVKYAREDTRYLLFIYDRLKKELLQAGAKTQSSLLFQALQNSSKICLQVYAKPQPTAADALAMGEKLKATAGIRAFSELQTRVLTALYLWRDRVAREEDESTAYVLPNHALMKLTKHLPVRSEQLYRACHPVPALVRKHAHHITSMIAAEKAKLAEEEAKAAPQDNNKTTAAVTTVQPKRTTWNEDGEQNIDADADADAEIMSSRKRTGRAEYARWQSGKRKAGVADDVSAVGSSVTSSGDSRHLALGAADKPVVKMTDSTTLLDKVNAMVASTSFTVTENAPSQPVETPESTASEVKQEQIPKETKPSMPQSISETYHLSNRTKRRKTTPVDASVASNVKDRAQKFMQRTGEEQPSEESGFQSFDYAAASAQVAGAQFKLEENRNQGSGGRGGKRNQKQAAGYNPFMAMSGAGGRGGKGGKGAGSGADDDSKFFGPQGGRKQQPAKKMHHMPRSATFR